MNATRLRAFTLLYLMLSACATEPTTQPLEQQPESGVEREVKMLEGVRLEIVSNSAFPVKGRYLVALNYMPSHMEKKPPFRSLLLAIGGDGKVDLLGLHDSQELRVFITDFRPLPDGLYSYALNRARGPRWSYELRFIDSRTGANVPAPAIYPLSDPDLDGHETITYAGDRRFFLFYRDREENGKEYIDMEIRSVDAATGALKGRWNSRGQFPPDMASDYLHINSLYPMSQDRVLASARTTSTLYVINLATGKIEDQIDSQTWKVLDDPMNGFLFQHTARFLPNGNLVLFDNRAGEPGARSRAAEYAVDWTARTLRLVWEQRVEESIPFRLGWGSVQVIHRDQVLVGWGDYPRTPGYCDDKRGTFPVFTQVTRAHELVFELRAPCGWHTFRAYFVPE
jgi:hypothetical protein